MKASTIIATAVVGVATVSAQAGLANLPPCALNCAIPALATSGCELTDVRCICSNAAFIGALTPCVQRDCTPEQVETTITEASALCLQNSVTLVVPTPTAAPTSDIASSVSSVISSIISSQSSVSSVLSSVVSEISSVISNATTSGSVPVPTGNSTTTTTGGSGSPSETDDVPAPSGTDGSAAGRNTVALGGLGAVAVAFAAFFL